ncbi:MAG: hypothetical protein KGH60_04045 [Candidatus Micrarchaeota archaeon]|nr:hypothetical protein [Candidatus Micrarchaeota archaeon]
MHRRVLTQEEIDTHQKRFDSLGDWVHEKRISDYPCLGGDNVSISHIFSQIVKRSSVNALQHLPSQILDTVKYIQKLGYDNDQVAHYIHKCDIMTRSHILDGGIQFIADMEYIAFKSKSKEEFEARYKKLDGAFTSRMHSLNADYSFLERKD